MYLSIMWEAFLLYGQFKNYQKCETLVIISVRTVSELCHFGNFLMKTCISDSPAGFEVLLMQSQEIHFRTLPSLNLSHAKIVMGTMYKGTAVNHLSRLMAKSPMNPHLCAVTYFSSYLTSRKLPFASQNRLAVSETET